MKSNINLRNYISKKAFNSAPFSVLMDIVYDNYELRKQLRDCNSFYWS